ncbi:MAG: sulfur carrier protein ThiS [Epsilonproteobacteria bacterium]|nr:sulfur carrier protein ThiS [Campylobacterota bacterium]
MISIKINNRDKQIEENSSINALLEFLDLKPSSVIVEVNLNIIKKDRYDKFILKDEDNVEIITFMGGG